MRPRNSRGGSRREENEPSKSSLPLSFGSRAERKFHVSGTVARHPNMGWASEGEISPEDGMTMEGTCIRPSDNNSINLQDSENASSFLNTTLLAEQGLVRIQPSVQLRVYANSVSETVRDRALGKHMKKKKPIFSPRQIAQNFELDADFTNLFQSRSISARTSNEHLKQQVSSSDLMEHTPQGGLNFWKYKSPQNLERIAAKNKAEAVRRYAEQILKEQCMNERNSTAVGSSLRQAQQHRLNTTETISVAQVRESVHDHELKGESCSIEGRSLGTPRVDTLHRSRCDNQNASHDSDQDLFKIHTSPTQLHGGTSPSKKRSDLEVDRKAKLTHNAEGEDTLKERDNELKKSPLRPPQPAHRQWHVAREYVAIPRECAQQVRQPVSPVAALKPVPPPVPPKAVAFGRAGHQKALALSEMQRNSNTPC